MKTIEIGFILLVIQALLACAVTGNSDGAAQTSNPEIVGSVLGQYRIGPGDILNISVWKEEGMQKEVLVKPDGGINFPLVGDIMATGLTTAELKQVLVDQLTHFIPNPVLTVSVMKSRSNKVYVVGKVVRAGEFFTDGYMDVLQALSLAGGVTPYADSDNIKIMRRSSGIRQLFQFDYDEVINGNRLDMNIILEAGDTVVVP